MHSGSDKFSIYAPMRRALRKSGAGVHLKTAGTTWLEELIGLAEAGGEGLDLAKQVYAKAFEHREALCEPYATVIDIDYARLPAPAAVERLERLAIHFGAAPRPGQSRLQSRPAPIAACGLQGGRQDGDAYLAMLEACEASISRNVTGNLFDRHIVPLFLED